MKKLTMAVLAMLALGAADVAAQAATGNATVSVPEVLSITVDQTNIAFPTVTATDFENGYVDAGVTSNLDTSGNVVHDLTIAANNTVFGFTATGTATDPSKPASDLSWSLDGATYNALSTTQADVQTALPRGQNVGAASVVYRIGLSLANDVPGDYTLGFTYTVVPN